MSRVLNQWLLAVVLGATAPVALGAPPSFSPWPDSVGAAALQRSGVDQALVRVPFWWDVTQDREADLLYGSVGGLLRLHSPSAEARELVPVALTSDASAVLFGDDQVAGVDWNDLVFAPIDIDNDGQDELLVVGKVAALWKVKGPDEVGLWPLPLPELRARGVNDVAIGDLNRDGLADIYLALGTAYPERLRLSGRPDLILMNRGQGRFEAIDAEPTRRAVTNSITLADIDGDGWLDVIESVDGSSAAGPSRLLWNRSAPGDTVPTFEPSAQRWDPGTYGMGVAVADVDQDGLLDLYNTSIGRDLLMAGRGDGHFEDVTLSRGVLHEWSSLGLRIQWSPTFVDLDGDGRLDLLVRHGVAGNLGGGGAVHSWASDLLYQQTASGAFERLPVPETQGAGGGRRLIVGDVDGDGRPDAARDASLSAGLFWENTTPTSAEERRLTLRLSPSVSPSPTTGAVVQARCAGASLTRHLTAGGAMGATAAPELHFAWSQCAAEPVELTISWPSGARSLHTLEGEETVWRVDEPRWITHAEAGPIVLDPTGTSASEACVGNPDEGWQCCEARCEVERPTIAPILARLDDAPPLSLPPQESRWLFVSDPYLPVPGEDLTLHLMHVGDAEGFSLSSAALFDGDTAIPWETLDEAMGSMSASIPVPESATEVRLRLRVDGSDVASFQRATGHLIDFEKGWQDLYPVRPAGTHLQFGAWALHLHSPPGRFDPLLANQLSLSTPEGAMVPISQMMSDGAMRRISLEVIWDDLEGIDTLWLRDAPQANPLELPVFWRSDPQALPELIQGFECGLQRSRLRAGGDETTGVISALGPEGRPMLLPPTLLSVEIEGGELSQHPDLVGGLQDMFFGVRAGDALGAGRVTIRESKSGKEGSCDFQVMDWPTQPVDAGQSWATLSTTTLDRGLEETTRLRVGIANRYGELLGGDVPPTVLVVGGEWVTPLRVTDAGTLAGDIGPGEEDSLRITVTLEGQIIEQFIVEVSGEAPGAALPEGSTPLAPDDGGTGCHGGSAPSPLWLLLTSVLVALHRSGANKEALS